MRDLKKIQDELGENETALSKIQIRLEKAKNENEKAKQAYSRALMEDLPAEDLEPTRQALMEKQADLDGLFGIRELLQNARAESEKEMALVSLYTEEVEKFHQASGAYEASISTLESEATALQELVNRVSNAIATMFRSLERATVALSWVNDRLPAEYNLEGFLSGNLTAADGEIRENVLNGAGDNLKGRIGSFEVPKITLMELNSLLERMTVWRRKIINLKSGSALIQNRQQLVPNSKEKIRVDSETLHAEREMKKQAAA